MAQPGETREKAQNALWWKHPRAIKTGITCAFLAVICCVGWYVYFRPYVTTDDARFAATMVRIAPEASGGRIIRMNAAEGDRVERNAVLVELDHRTAEAQLVRAQTRMQLAAKELKRTEQLAAQNGVATKEVDAAHAAAQGAEAELRLAELAVEHTSLKSPISGVIVQKSTEVGNIIEPGQTVYTVADVEHAWVSANIEETSIGRIKVGMPVVISIDAGGSCSGKVAEIRAATASQFSLIPAENASGNFTKLVQRIPVKIAIDVPPESLRVGESVVVKIKVL